MERGVVEEAGEAAADEGEGGEGREGDSGEAVKEEIVGEGEDLGDGVVIVVAVVGRRW